MKDNDRIIQVGDRFEDVFRNKTFNTMDKEPMLIKLKEIYIPKANIIPCKLSNSRLEDDINEIRNVKWNCIDEPVGGWCE